MSLVAHYPTNSNLNLDLIGLVLFYSLHDRDIPQRVLNTMTMYFHLRRVIICDDVAPRLRS